MTLPSLKSSLWQKVRVRQDESKQPIGIMQICGQIMYYAIATGRADKVYVELSFPGIRNIFIVTNPNEISSLSRVIDNLSDFPIVCCVIDEKYDEDMLGDSFMSKAKARTSSGNVSKFDGLFFY